MKGKLKSPQNKGKKFEYFIRDLLKGYGFEARRTPLSGAIDGWSGDITSNFPMFIECKNTAKTTFPQWWKKSNDESGSKPPVIFWNHKGQAFAFLLASDLLNALTNKPIIKEKFGKKPKLQREDKTIGLQFSKSNQLHKLTLDKTSK